MAEVIKNGNVLPEMPSELHEDKEVVMMTVAHFGRTNAATGL